MKVIEHRNYGEKGKFLTPSWQCLIHPNRVLAEYYRDVLGRPFTKKCFRGVGVCKTIGKIQYPNLFSKFKGMRCLDMPIKMAGSKDYRIPSELIRFIEPISTMVAFETAHNKNILDFYAYLTVDQSVTKPNQTHRTGGLHVDGFQGARINPKVICDRSYLVTDCDCPSFWNQPFETVEAMDDATQNIFHEFDRTKLDSSEIRCKPYEIYMMDCYAVHSANMAQKYRRTFCRLSFSVRQYDRLGNSHNNCFDYSWNMVERDISKILK